MIKTDYLGYVVTCKGIKSQQKNIEAIRQIARPKMVKVERRCLVKLQYHHDLWQKYIHILAPLIELTDDKKTLKSEWNESCRKALVNTKNYWQEI